MTLMERLRNLFNRQENPRPKAKDQSQAELDAAKRRSEEIRRRAEALGIRADVIQQRDQHGHGH